MPGNIPFQTFISTMINVAVTSQTVVISSNAVIFHSLSNNNMGMANDAKVEIINASYSTFTDNPDIPFSISGATPTYKPSSWDVYLDSGLAVNLTGAILPNVTVIYRRR